MGASVRILVVDDSEVFTDLMTQAIRSDAKAELAGVARNGREAVEMARRLEPDVISMDVYMPEMDGLDAVEHIMEETPTPIVMVTAATSEDMAHISFRAIGSGALDVLEKPANRQDTARIVLRLRLMAGVGVRRRARGKAPVGTNGKRPDAIAASGEAVVPWGPGVPLRAVEVVAIAISTGGPPMLERVLRALTPDWSATLLVVQHLSSGFGSHLVEWLGRTSGIPVALASSGAPIRRGAAFVAPADQHLTVRMGGRLHVDGTRDRVDGHRPSGTLLLESTALVYGSRAGGLVLTGMGEDGARGLLALRGAGGLTAAQDAASSAVDGMPRSARSLGAAEYEVTGADLPAYVRVLGGLSASSEGSP